MSAPSPPPPPGSSGAGSFDPSELDPSNGAPGWRDLSLNRPGDAVRAKALEAKQVAPVRALIARALGIRTEQRAWKVGADGEMEVGRQLRKLGPGWHVIHAVPVGTRESDIDHVVIGPAGVFTLNTKNHGRSSVWVAENTFMVNGKKTEYLQKSRFEAERAAKLLSGSCGFDVLVEPVIVVMAGALLTAAPPLLIYFVLGKFFIQGITAGALKG